MSNKYFDLLPIQHQTSVNKNFFESTVEQLFSKANIENIQGFIGTPRESQSNTVFISQPAPNRDYYSFDPVVTTVDSVSGKPTNLTFYEDFLYDLRNESQCNLFQLEQSMSENQLFYVSDLLKVTLFYP